MHFYVFFAHRMEKSYFFMHFYEGRKESLWERARGMNLYVFSFVLIRKQCFSCIFTRVGNNANGNVLGTCILTCFSFVEIKNSFSIFLRGLKIMRMGKWLESYFLRAFRLS